MPRALVALKTNVWLLALKGTKVHGQVFFSPRVVR